MIPRKIHYCWFGGAPLPAQAEKCIASWRKFCPDFELIRWDESNFDLNVTFVVDDSGVVSVDDSGVVTALKNGTAQITVNVGDNKKYALNSTVMSNITVI